MLLIRYYLIIGNKYLIPAIKEHVITVAQGLNFARLRNLRLDNLLQHVRFCFLYRLFQLILQHIYCVSNIFTFTLFEQIQVMIKASVNVDFNIFHFGKRT